MTADPVDRPAELPKAWMALQNKSSGTERQKKTPKDPSAKHGIEYRYTTLLPSGKPTVQIWPSSPLLNGLQKVAYEAQIMLVKEVPNHMILTAQLFFYFFQQRVVQRTHDAHT